MNFFGNRRSSHRDSTPSISFSMGMPSLPTSSQQQAEASPSSSSTPSSLTLTRGTSSTPRDRHSNGNPSQQIELVTPQSSSSVVKTNILPEFSIDYESDDEDSFEDVEFGGSNAPTTINGGCTAEQEMNQRGVTRKLLTPHWIPTNMVQLGLCLGIVTFLAVAVVVVVVSLTTVSSPTTATTSTTNTNSAIDAATGSTFHHNVSVDSIWMPPPGNGTRRALRFWYP